MIPGDSRPIFGLVLQLKLFLAGLLVDVVLAGHNASFIFNQIADYLYVVPIRRHITLSTVTLVPEIFVFETLSAWKECRAG